MHMEPAPTHGRLGPGDVPPVEHELRVARAAAEEGRKIVLVEGRSDKAAIDALAKRRGRDLHDEGITTIPIGGATKIWAHGVWMLNCPVYAMSGRNVIFDVHSSGRALELILANPIWRRLGSTYAMRILKMN